MFPELLTSQHQRSEAILAQDCRIRGQGLNDGSSSEEVGGVITQRDPALQVDSTGVEVCTIGRSPAQVYFPQVVDQILVGREIQIVFTTEIQTVAQREV